MKCFGELRGATTLLKVHRGGLHNTFLVIILQIYMSILQYDHAMVGGAKYLYAFKGGPQNISACLRRGHESFTMNEHFDMPQMATIVDNSLTTNSTMIMMMLTTRTGRLCCL